MKRITNHLPQFVNEMRLAVSAATERSSRRSSRFTDMIAPQPDTPLQIIPREPLLKTKRVIKKEHRKPDRRSSDSSLSGNSRLKHYLIMINSCAYSGSAVLLSLHFSHFIIVRYQSI